MGDKHEFTGTEVHDENLGDVETAVPVEASSFEEAKEQLEGELDMAAAIGAGQGPDDQSVTEIRDESTGETRRFD